MRKKNMPIVATTGDITEPVKQYVKEENNTDRQLKQKKNPRQFSQKEAGSYNQFMADEMAEALAKIHLNDYKSEVVDESDVEEEDYDQGSDLESGYESEVVNEFDAEEEGCKQESDFEPGYESEVDNEDNKILNSTLSQLAALQSAQEELVYSIGNKHGFFAKDLDPMAYMLKPEPKSQSSSSTNNTL